MKRKLFLAALLLGLVLQSAQSQIPHQIVKGTIVDKESKQPLAGVTVVVKDLTPAVGAITDVDGAFVMPSVPVGRQQLVCTYVGYEPYVSEPFVLNSAKEMVLNIEIIGAVLTTSREAVVTYVNKGNTALNEAAVVSTRSFSVDETQRYAAAANDPGRMAQGLPGVQVSRDNRSDIVIRGNSGVGLLWRLEGIDIPNPNHFARRGTSGGGITIFSISMLTNSDFSTGAFPAEYGNATSGVFDIRFRKGNPEKREHTFRAGLLGLDYSTEGPINKKTGSSYLVNYRYSTLGILNKMGLYLVGPRTDNTFQDLSFNLHFPTKNRKHSFGLWGMGGKSQEDFKAVEGVENWHSFDDYHTYYFTTDMGAVGFYHSVLLSDDAYIKTSLAAMSQHIVNRDDTLATDMRGTTYNNEDYIEGRYVLSSYLSKKFNAKTSLKTGFFLNDVFYNLKWQIPLVNPTASILDDKGSTFLVQPYAQLRIRPNAFWTINAGVHAMYLTLNGDFSLEPRLGVRYQINEKQGFSFAYGIHSRMLPIGAYFANPMVRDPNLFAGDGVNEDLKFLKAHHLVLGYDIALAKATKIKAEVYYQHLFDVPVDASGQTSWSMLNTVSGFPDLWLSNKGTGDNYGLDLSVEKSFEGGSFMLLSGSVFQSEYTDFNGNTNPTIFSSGMMAS